MASATTYHGFAATHSLAAQKEEKKKVVEYGVGNDQYRYSGDVMRRSEPEHVSSTGVRDHAFVDEDDLRRQCVPVKDVDLLTQRAEVLELDRFYGDQKGPEDVKHESKHVQMVGMHRAPT